VDRKSKRKKRKIRIRKKVKGTKDRPRVSVFRSNRHIYAQVIDDEKHITLASLNDLKIKTKKTSKKEIARSVGEELAKILKKKKIKSVVFDRGGYKYHGRVKEIAEALRNSGIKF
jgi:large subunit ribosomal protein L18